MACLGDINCDSNIEGSPFIIAEEGTITAAAEEIESLETQVGDAITQIESEITGGGLDEYSLYVNGSSPAYDEAMEIVKDLSDIKEVLSKLAESYEQNRLEHYSKELDKYIEKVKEKRNDIKIRVVNYDLIDVAIFAKMARLVHLGKLSINVAREYNLAQIKDAYMRAEKGNLDGKVVVNIREDRKPLFSDLNI